MVRAGLIFLLLGAACTDDLARKTLAEQCELNTECGAPLVCRLGRCRNECNEARDCPYTTVCLSDNDGLGACGLVEADRCALNTDCPEPLRCAGGRCLNTCEATECLPGARCDVASSPPACVPIEGARCGASEPCSEGLVCHADGRCRVTCAADRDCPEGARCAGGRCRGITTPRPDGGLDGGPEAGAPDGAGFSIRDAGPFACDSLSLCRDRVAHATLACEMGLCVVSACTAPYLDCDRDARNGCETNPAAHRENCGGCDMPCGAGEQCFDAVCAPATPSSLGLGATHTLIAWSTGRVTSFGANNFGALGNGESGVSGGEADVQLVEGLTDASEVAGGQQHSCALRATGQVVCWGANGSGQVGDGVPIGTAGMAVVPGANVIGISDAVQVVAGSHHACARHATGAVSCWGDNYSDQLGPGFTGTDSSTPILVPGVNARSIRARYAMSCALDVSGSVICWGDEYPASATIAIPTTETIGAIGMAGSESTSLHYLAITADGDPYCWGRTVSAVDFICGLGELVNDVDPPRLMSLTNVASNSGYCARTGDELWCWGRNSYGGAGTGTDETPYDVPVRAVSAPPIRDFASGDYHVCVVGTDDVVRCVGQNRFGQLGDGTFANRPWYRPVEGH